MKRITYLIDRFWTKTATAEERRELLNYLESQDAELRNQMEEEFQLLKEEFSATPLSKVRASELFQSIRHTAGIHEEQPLPTFFQRIKPLIQLSAAAVILFFLTWSAYRIFIGPPVILSDERNLVASVRDTIYHVNEGTEEQKIMLEDGSTVTLYPGSKLSYLTHFETQARDLYLDGLAKFEVAKDTSRPFTVLANGYSTTALGTVFIVNTNETDMVKVNLLSGKVVVRASATARLALTDTYLHPGDELTIHLSKGQWAVQNKTVHDKMAKDRLATAKPTVDNDEYLVFNKTPLDEVFTRITQKYGYDIDSKGVTLEHLSFTGSFKQTDPLSSIMNIICSMNDLEYRQEEQKIQIIKK